MGVAGDRFLAARGDMDGVQRVAHVYIPHRFGDARSVSFHLRANGDPLVHAPAATAILRAAQPNLVIMTPRVLGDALREGTREIGFFANLFTAFGAAALLFAASGIYGVVAYTVSRRSREIGIRMTLGTTPRRILGHIAGSILPWISAGMAAGLTGAIALGFFVCSTLFGVNPADPLALAASLTFFLLTALLAAGVPAMKAAETDPLTVTRGSQLSVVARPP